MFTITDKAIAELKQILSGPDMPEKAAIRVFAQSQGCCSSHQLGIEIADLSKTDLKGQDFNGLTVLMDEQAEAIAQKATIDFYDHLDNPGFRVLWQKSEEGGSCGCN
ncbi:MAG: iron-sulfur cluster biosynthesis family protein [Bacteroidales bacterium]